MPGRNPNTTQLDTSGQDGTIHLQPIKRRDSYGHLLDTFTHYHDQGPSIEALDHRYPRRRLQQRLLPRRRQPHSRHSKQNIRHTIRRSRPTLLRRLNLRRAHAERSKLPTRNRRLDAPPRPASSLGPIRRWLLKHRPLMP